MAELGSRIRGFVLGFSVTASQARFGTTHLLDMGPPLPTRPVFKRRACPGGLELQIGPRV